jgi:hypothetical protein
MCIPPPNLPHAASFTLAKLAHAHTRRMKDPDVPQAKHKEALLGVLILLLERQENGKDTQPASSALSGLESHCEFCVFLLCH